MIRAVRDVAYNAAIGDVACNTNYIQGTIGCELVITGFSPIWLIGDPLLGSITGWAGA